MNKDVEFKPRLKGRPLWKVPRDFILDPTFELGLWRSLSQASKAVLPVIGILSCQGMCDAATATLAHYAGRSCATVNKALADLRKRQIIPETYLCRRAGGKFPHSKKFLAHSLEESEAFGIFPRYTVINRIWASLSGSAQALYLPLHVGVQTNALKRFAGAAKCNGEHPDFPVEPAASWFDENGHFAWELFMKHHWDELSNFIYADYVPFVSFKKGDQGRTNVSALGRLAGLDRKTVRTVALPELEEKHLLLAFRFPGSSLGIFLPPHTLWREREQRESSGEIIDT